MSSSLRTLKGVGEKTEKLFAKIGIVNIDGLLHYYPRNYDAYEEPVEIKDLEEGAVAAVSATIITGVYVNQVAESSGDHDDCCGSDGEDSGYVV